MAFDDKYVLTGREFQWIRENAGYSRRDLATLIATRPWKQKINTPFGVQSLEQGQRVRSKYVDCLIDLVGKGIFEHWYELLEDRRKKWGTRNRLRHDQERAAPEEEGEV